MVDADMLGALARAAGHGDQEALAALVQESYDSVWRYVARVVDRQSADDLTQETFIRAMHSLPSFRGDCTVLVWLLSIARCAAMDHFRAQKRRPFLLFGLSGDPPDAMGMRMVADPGAESDLLGLVWQLEPARRRAFVLTQVLGYTYAEAATLCGVPVGTVRSRVARARENLLEMLASAETGAVDLEPLDA